MCAELLQIAHRRSPLWAYTELPSTALLEKVLLRVQCCLHAELSFGGSSYLIQRPEGNVLVDVPRYNPKLLNRIKVLPRCLALGFTQARVCLSLCCTCYPNIMQLGGRLIA